MITRRYPQLLPEYFIALMRETYRRRRERIAAIRRPAAARAYVAEVRRAIRRAFGSLPPRTPLNARTTKTSVRDGFRIETLVYESRPGYQVTANLYRPDGGPERGPAVLFPCGHSHNGKADRGYVKACVRLARTGYVVLCYDPINQGERDMYSPLDRPGKPTRDNPCTGHNNVGKQLSVAGDWFGAWRLWDGIRGVDYLLSRPEVDPSRIGVTGQSGGGTLSGYLWANDHRLKMAASCCWATSMLNDIENGMPTDDEQCPPGWLAAGFDKIDFFIARAGEPTLLLGVDSDFFDNRGLETGFRELRKLHRLLGGSAVQCRLSFSPGPHEYTDEGQTDMIRFFNRVCGNRREPADIPEALPSEPELLATPAGDVHRNGSTPVYKLAAALARSAAGCRPRARSAPALARAVARTLSLRPPRKAPPHRRMFHTAEWRAEPRQRVSRFLVETEPGILCVLRQVETSAPDIYRLRPPKEARLYVPNVCSQAELELPATMAGHGRFYTLDLRGLGEGLLDGDDVRRPYGHEYMAAAHARMYGRTLLGMRVFDLLSAVRLLLAEGAEMVHLTGRGLGAVPALLSALFEERIATVTEIEAPESFLALATEPLGDWPAVCFPRGVLACFDLPDVRRALGQGLATASFADPGRMP